MWSATSCSHYIDNAKSNSSIKVADGTLAVYPDSNVLNFRSTTGIAMDNERHSPIPFITRLPKGIKWWDMSLPYWFVFYYDNNQTVVIDIDYRDPGAAGSASYVPGEAGIDSVKRQTHADGDKRYDLRRISTDSERKTLMIRKGAARILLYNIKPARFDAFVADLNGFRFVR
jgi:hypothetical protein